MQSLLSSFFHNPRRLDPDWLTRDLEGFENSGLSELKLKLANTFSEHPEASIIIPAFNEEANIIRSLETLANNKSRYSFEVIVINNNSSDRTEEVLKKLGVRYFNQPIQGCGAARQMGLEHARGKYILLADADCLYPKKWVESMITELRKPGTSVVYGRYSFLANKNSYPRWVLSFYELLRDVSMEMRHFKRPFLNSYGMTMAFYRDQALKEGFRVDSTRGEDGRMCFDLMKYGKVRRLRSYKAGVWTGTRTIAQEGSLVKVLFKRFLNYISHIDEYFKPLPEHDTKSSVNHDDSVSASIRRVKEKTRISSSGKQ